MTVSTGIPVETLATRDQLWLLGEILQADWSSGVEIASSFRTEVASPVGAAEQRYGRTPTPTRSVSALLRGYSPESVRALKAWAMRTTVARTPFPTFPDQTRVTAAASAGVQVIACDTTLRRFSGLIRVAVVKNPSRSELVKGDRLHISTATSVTASQVVLADPLPFAVSPGDIVIPLMESRLLLNHSGLTHTDRVASLQAQALEFEGRTQLPSAATLGEVTTAASYQGLPIFDLPIDWKSPIPWSMSRRGGYSESGVAAIAETYGDRGLVGYDLPVLGLDRTDAWKIIRFFDSRGGRLHPFWLPSPTTDVVSYFGAINSTTVIVRTGGPIIDWNFRPYLLLELKTGERIIRPVSSVSNLSGNDLVTLSEGLPSTYTPSQVARASFAYKMRLASDELVEQWITTETMRATLPVIETEREVVKIINDLTEIETTPFSGGATIGACSPVPLYRLRDCKGVGADVITDDSEFLDLLGKSVTFGPEICYTVETIADTGQFRSSGIYPLIDEVFDSCLCCSPNIDSAGCCTGQPDGTCAFPLTLPSLGGLRVEFEWDIVDLRAGCCQDDNFAKFRYIHQNRSISGSESVVPTLSDCRTLDAAHTINFDYTNLATGQFTNCPGESFGVVNDTFDLSLSIDYAANGSLSLFSLDTDAFNLSLEPAISPNPAIETAIPIPDGEDPEPVISLCFSPEGCITAGSVLIPQTGYSSVASSGRCGANNAPISTYGLLITFRLTRNGTC